MKLTIHIHVVSRLKMSGALSPLPHTSSCRAQGQVFLNLWAIRENEYLSRYPEYPVVWTTGGIRKKSVFRYCHTLWGNLSPSEQRMWRFQPLGWSLFHNDERGSGFPHLPADIHQITGFTFHYTITSTITATRIQNLTSTSINWIFKHENVKSHVLDAIKWRQRIRVQSSLIKGLHY